MHFGERGSFRARKPMPIYPFGGNRFTPGSHWVPPSPTQFKLPMYSKNLHDMRRHRASNLNVSYYPNRPTYTTFVPPGPAHTTTTSVAAYRGYYARTNSATCNFVPGYTCPFHRYGHGPCIAARDCPKPENASDNNSASSSSSSASHNLENPGRVSQYWNQHVPIGILVNPPAEQPLHCFPLVPVGTVSSNTSINTLAQSLDALQINHDRVASRNHAKKASLQHGKDSSAAVLFDDYDNDFPALTSEPSASSHSSTGKRGKHCAGSSRNSAAELPFIPPAQKLSPRSDTSPDTGISDGDDISSEQGAAGNSNCIVNFQLDKDPAQLRRIPYKMIPVGVWFSHPVGKMSFDPAHNSFGAQQHQMSFYGHHNFLHPMNFQPNPPQQQHQNYQSAQQNPFQMHMKPETHANHQNDFDLHDSNMSFSPEQEQGAAGMEPNEMDQQTSSSSGAEWDDTERGMVEEKEHEDFSPDFTSSAAQPHLFSTVREVKGGNSSGSGDVAGSWNTVGSKVRNDYPRKELSPRLMEWLKAPKLQREAEPVPNKRMCVRSPWPQQIWSGVSEKKDEEHDDDADDDDDSSNTQMKELATSMVLGLLKEPESNGDDSNATTLSTNSKSSADATDGTVTENGESFGAIGPIQTSEHAPEGAMIPAVPQPQYVAGRATPKNGSDKDESAGPSADWD